MRVLLVHNSYQQRGGEDAVFEAERELLLENGASVVEYRLHNDAVESLGKLDLATTTVWSRRAYRELRELIDRQRPDVAHFHNTLPLISPAGHWAAHRAGIPVVQTLHNYRLMCPSALLFRDGRTCTDCVGKLVATPAIRHACYRDSRSATAAIAGMLTTHRLLGTWRRAVDVFIALTPFARDQFVAGGIERERLAIKPNFLATDPGVGTGPRSGYLFVGRLTEEKGVRVLLEAAQRLPADERIRIVGGGPLADEVRAAATDDARLEFLGEQPRERVLDEMRRARALVFPSTWFEGFPMTIVEAFATGLPVVASRIGSMASIIVPGHNGEHFAPGDSEQLVNALRRLGAGDDAIANCERLSRGARADFEHVYDGRTNFDVLTRIYAAARASRAAGHGHALDLAARGLDRMPAGARAHAADAFHAGLTVDDVPAPPHAASVERPEPEPWS